MENVVPFTQIAVVPYAYVMSVFWGSYFTFRFYTLEANCFRNGVRVSAAHVLARFQLIGGPISTDPICIRSCTVCLELENKPLRESERLTRAYQLVLVAYYRYFARAISSLPTCSVNFTLSPSQTTMRDGKDRFSMSRIVPSKCFVTLLTH